MEVGGSLEVTDDVLGMVVETGSEVIEGFDEVAIDVLEGCDVIGDVVGLSEVEGFRIVDGSSEVVVVV